MQVYVYTYLHTSSPQIVCCKIKLVPKYKDD